MVAVKTRFDGQRIETPPELKGAPPTEVLVVFQTNRPAQGVSGSAWDVIGRAPRPRTREDIESQLNADRDAWDR